MYTFLGLLCVVAVGAQNPYYSGGRTGEANAPITHYENNLNPDGSYNYAYGTANGIQAQEQGFLKYPGTPGEAQAAQGSYSYTAPNGEQVTVQYTADENGFRPQGSHISRNSVGNPAYYNGQNDYYRGGYYDGSRAYNGYYDGNYYNNYRGGYRY